MRVAVCSVGVGAHFPEAVGRLDESLTAVGYAGERALWRGAWPKRCPDHGMAPYGFKPWVLTLCQLDGFDLAFWVDSIVVAVRPLDSLIRYTVEHGCYFHGPDQSTGAWTNDRTLAAFNVTRDEAMTIPMICAGVMGLDLRVQRARTFLRRWLDAARDGLFRGVWDNRACSESPDPRCLGHRHDQSVASLLIHEMGLPMTQRYFRFDAHPEGEPTLLAQGWP